MNSIKWDCQLKSKPLKPFQMKRKVKEVPGFDEIIFENRNKEYGAYMIRKKYLPAAFWSTLSAIALFSAVIIGLFVGSEKSAKGTDTDIRTIVAEFDKTITDPNKVKIDIPEIPKIKIKPQVYIPPVIVDKVDTNDIRMTGTDIHVQIDNRPLDTVVKYIEDKQVEVEPEPKIFIIVSEMPEFPGGNDMILKYLSENLKYPEKAVENGIQGRVTVKFVVWTDGSIRKIEILRGVDPLLDQEAIRVISEMPKWKPGKNNGTPVPVYYSVPVIYTIKNNQ